MPMIKILILHAKHEVKEIRANAFLSLISISSSENTFSYMLISAGVVDVVKEMLMQRNSSQICQACLLLSNLVASGTDVITTLWNLGIYDQVQQLLRDDNIYIIKEVVWIIQNSFFIATELQVEDLLSKGLLQLTIDLLHIKDPSLQIHVTKFLGKFLIRSKDFINEELKERIKEKLYEAKEIDLLVMHPNKEISELALKLINIL